MQRESVQNLVESFIARKFPGTKYKGSISMIPLIGGKNEVLKVTVTLNSKRHTWVVKQTSVEEVQALRLLAEHQVTGVPRLLEHQITGGQCLILLPEYSGHHGDFGDELPENILQVLARIHAFFLNQDCDLPASDSRFYHSLFNESFGNPEIYPTGLRRQVRKIRNSADSFASMANGFTQTLVHWDVHPGNILVNGDASVLLDWGNARQGPAMIDLANLVSWESSDFRIYVSAYESLSQEPFDYERRLIEYNWCRALTEVKYLPYGAKHMSSDVVALKVNDVLNWIHAQS